MAQATFYFDLGSPFAYLAAERLHEVLPRPVSWQPVSLGGLFRLNGRSSWSLDGRDVRRAGMAEVGRRAELYGLPPVRWPDPWPTNYLFAMRAATYASQVGAGREFAVCAFRHAFVNGRDLGAREHVLRAAAEVGLDPQSVEREVADPQLKLALRTATEAAHAIGVFGVPTIAIDGEVFWGDDRLPETAEALRRSSR
ncbi:MAG TPA: 2-hydroxychromene-2-carboxylate isomerase [Solirubrobacteraceae bacterium]|nr:2-hydroxychromene-2-carboxylate isomerase [Solirubrobacteraceae bacterium]